jgi:hypothetical protein
MSHSINVSLPSFEERLAEVGVADAKEFSIVELAKITGALTPMNTRRLVKKYQDTNGATGIPARLGKVANTNTPKWYIARDDAEYRYDACRAKLERQLVQWNAPVIKKAQSRRSGPSWFDQVMMLPHDERVEAILKHIAEEEVATA